MKPQPQPHIPTLIGLIILVISLGAIISIIETGIAFFTSQKNQNQPQEITITNVTDNSFTVNWITKQPSTGMLIYFNKGLLSLKKQAIDVSDQPDLIKPRQIHSFTAVGLSDNTTYQFEIVKDNFTYKDKSFTVTTGQKLTTPFHIVSPAFGTIVDSQNNPVKEALVLGSFSGSQKISSLVDNGTWILPLGSLRSEAGDRHYIPKSDDMEELKFINPEGSTVVKTTIDHDSPLPKIRLGEVYDFTQKQSVVPGLIIAQAQPASQLLAMVNNSFQILSPQDKTAVPSGRPAIYGTGIPNEAVTLVITGVGSPFITKVYIDQNGRWSFTPQSPLSPNNYIVTAVSKNTSGQTVSLARSFIILKSGTQVLQAATPSASVVPTPSPSPFASPVVTVSASPSASPSGEIPELGTTEITWLILGIASMLVLGGIFSPGIKNFLTQN